MEQLVFDILTPPLHISAYLNQVSFGCMSFHPSLFFSTPLSPINLHYYPSLFSDSPTPPSSFTLLISLPPSSPLLSRPLTLFWAGTVEIHASNPIPRECSPGIVEGRLNSTSDFHLPRSPLYRLSSETVHSKDALVRPHVRPRHLCPFLIPFLIHTQLFQM